MEKYNITNRKGLNIVAEIEEIPNQKGLVFIVHGLGGFKEQHQMEAMKRAFSRNKYTVVRYDSTNAFGESDGKLEDATMTQYYQDLEDIIEWSKPQKWYQEPFVLIGHSVGGFCVLSYAIKYPERVKAVAPISPVVSGELFSQTHEMKEVIDEWKETGMREWESGTRPGVMKRLKYDFIEDALQYDLLKQALVVKVPTLIVVGDQDITTPTEHQVSLFNALSSEKDMHIIKGSGHTFREESGLIQLEDIISNWVRKL